MYVMSGLLDVIFFMCSFCIVFLLVWVTFVLSVTRHDRNLTDIANGWYIPAAECEANGGHRPLHYDGRNWCGDCGANQEEAS
jgi:hypothetical protein